MPYSGRLESFMDIIIAVLLLILIFLVIILIVKSSNTDPSKLEHNISDSTQRSVKLIGDIISENQKNIGSMQSENFARIDNSLINTQKMVVRQLEKIQNDNNIRLDEMRNMVEKKLEKSIDAKMTNSFKLVNDRLEQVYKGLGEMQALASGVGDLKKVLSNVKTRGIMGELQLKNILQEIMAPEQYEENVITIPGSRNMVEFAIKLPGNDGKNVYLPIDAKFPATFYHELVDAYESDDAERIKDAASALIRRIKSEAADIRSKYIEPPYTTDFAIMFLPFEGLYAEVINRGLVDELQSNYKINIAGPSTMAAMLNSLQTGFKTLAIEKRSAEVWDVLGAVKSEFDKFAEALDSAQKRINQANDDLDKLVGVRTRAIQRSLKGIEKIE
jgi:DNA recombination protein RmuC